MNELNNHSEINLDLEKKQETEQSFLFIIDLIKNGQFDKISEAFDNKLKERVERLQKNSSPQVAEKLNKISGIKDVVINSLQDWELDLKEFINILAKLDSKILGMEIAVNKKEQEQQNSIKDIFSQMDEEEKIAA